MDQFAAKYAAGYPTTPNDIRTAKFPKSALTQYARRPALPDAKPKRLIAQKADHPFALQLQMPLVPLPDCQRTDPEETPPGFRHSGLKRTQRENR